MTRLLQGVLLTLFVINSIGAAPSHLVPSRPSFDRPEGDEYIENRQYDRHRGDAQMWRHVSIEEGDDGRSIISR
jgi:hypothetical protein